MAKIIHRCETCEKEYDSQELAEQCEERHNKIQEQMKVIAKEVDKLYELGGKIKVSLGSNDNNTLDQIGMNRDDTITFKNWTAFGYQGNRLLFDADNYDIYR